VGKKEEAIGQTWCILKKKKSDFLVHVPTKRKEGEKGKREEVGEKKGPLATQPRGGLFFRGGGGRGEKRKREEGNSGRKSWEKKRGKEKTDKKRTTKTKILQEERGERRSWLEERPHGKAKKKS